MLKNLLRYGIPLIISVGLCYLLLAKVDVRQNVEIVARYCDYWWIALALACSVASHVIRALRWRIQLSALDIKPPLMTVIYSIFGTYAVNLVLPRLGEVWRTGYIANRQRAPFAKVFGSMVSDRVADTLTLLIIILLSMAVASSTVVAFIDSEPGRLDGVKSLLASPWLWTCVGILAVGAWLLLSRLPENKAIAKIRELWRGLWEGFVVILCMRGRGLWLFYTLLLWGCYFIQLYLAFFAFDFTRQILALYGAEAVLVCFVLSTIAMVVPSNGGIGPWQMAVIFGLSFYQSGISLPEGMTFETMSVAFANCVMTSQTILLIILGIFTFAAIALQKRHDANNQTNTNETTPNT